MAVMPTPVLLMDPEDEVAVCVEEVPAGARLDVGGRAVVTRQPIPAGHKVALVAIAAGGQVHKYGQPIGVARIAILAGEHVHVHNLDSLRVGGNWH